MIIKKIAFLFFPSFCFLGFYLPFYIFLSFFHFFLVVVAVFFCFCFVFVFLLSSESRLVNHGIFDFLGASASAEGINEADMVRFVAGPCIALAGKAVIPCLRSNCTRFSRAVARS